MRCRTSDCEGFIIISYNVHADFVYTRISSHVSYISGHGTKGEGMEFENILEVQEKLESQKYISSREISTVVFLAVAMEKPILVEGPAGVGKTELAKSIAKALGRPLIRMQCYEGLDESKSLYEWEYAKQLLYTQMLKDKITDIVSETASLADAVDEIANQRCCWWTRSTSPIPSSKPFSWSSSAIFRSPSPRSAP